MLAHEVAHVSERDQVEAVRDAQVAQGSAIVLQSLAAGAGAAVGGLVFQGMTAGPFYSQSQAVMAQLQADMLSRLVGQVVTQVGGAAGNMLVLSVYQGFNRKDEETADKLAVHYLYQAGFNMEDFISVLRKLEALEKSEKKALMVPHFLASHPDLPSRIASVQSVITALTAQKSGN